MYYFCRPKSLFSQQGAIIIIIKICSSRGMDTCIRKQPRSNYQGCLEILFCIAFVHGNRQDGAGARAGHWVRHGIHWRIFSKGFHPVHIPSSGSTEGIGWERMDRDGWMEQLWGFLFDFFLRIRHCLSDVDMTGLISFSFSPSSSPPFFSILNRWASFSVRMFTTTFCLPLLLDQIHRERERDITSL